MTFGLEMIRKLIHLTSLWIPLVYLFNGKDMCALLIYVATCLMLAFDLLRNISSEGEAMIQRLLKFGNVFRAHERGSLSGASYMLCGAAILINLVPPAAFILAYTILMIADSFAAILGIKFGTIKICGNKSLEGTLTFFVSSLMIMIYFSSTLSFISSHALAACFACTLAELFAKKLKVDDNLLIPLVFCLVFEMCNNFLS